MFLLRAATRRVWVFPGRTEVPGRDRVEVQATAFVSRLSGTAPFGSSPNDQPNTEPWMIRLNSQHEGARLQATV